MIITRPVHFIMWKERPIQFMTKEHSPTDYLEFAAMYDSEVEANGVIQTYDEPEQFEVIHGKIEVDI